jgi:succinylarginine dihydrolase
VFAAQNPDVIDQGVFHNDVIAVGNGNVLFYHEQAFADEPDAEQLRRALAASARSCSRCASTARGAGGRRGRQLPVQQPAAEQAGWPDGAGGAARVPRERGGVALPAQDSSPAAAPIDELIEFDLRQSMRNGGGPACLRLRVALTDAEARPCTRA